MEIVSLDYTVCSHTELEFYTDKPVVTQTIDLRQLMNSRTFLVDGKLYKIAVII
jgi:hypothetical protein